MLVFPWRVARASHSISSTNLEANLANQMRALVALTVCRFLRPLSQTENFVMFDPLLEPFLKTADESESV